MKYLSLLISAFLFSCSQPKNNEVPIVAFTIPDKNLVLEGMAYDAVEENFYFGIFNKRKILRVNSEGQALDFIEEGQDGVSAVAGLFIDSSNRQLWFCGSDKRENDQPTVFQYDLTSRKLINKYKDKSGAAMMFNDLVRLPDGTVYITDSFQPAIYKLDVDSNELVLVTKSDLIKHANGITATADGSFVFVSTSKGFARIDSATDSIKRILLDSYEISGNDGLYFYKNSLIGIQNVSFPPFVGQYFLDSTKSRIVKAKVLLADHPLFNIPTTGAVVKDFFYFLANSQLLNYDYESEKLISPEFLRDISILKLDLEQP